MEAGNEPNKKRFVLTASAVLDDGTIVEMVFRPELRRTLFAIYSAGRSTLQDVVDLGPDAKPSANNNLIKNEVVLLPSEPRIYGNQAQLVADIREFIHRYVDFGESFENVATHYVLLTWLYDAFNELPYLRLRGDYGSSATDDDRLHGIRSSARTHVQRPRRSQIPIERAPSSRLTHRGFLPWRLSDDGPSARANVRQRPSSETLIRAGICQYLSSRRLSNSAKLS